MRSSRTNGKLLAIGLQKLATLESRSWTGPELSTVREHRAQAGNSGPSGSKKGRDSWQDRVRTARDCSLAKAPLPGNGIGVLQLRQLQLEEG